MIRAAAKRLALWINRYANKEGLEFDKLKLGAEIFLISVSKYIIIYSLAVWLGVLPQTFATHVAYGLIKRYSFGLHALNSTVCTVVSCIMFVFIPLLLTDLRVNNYMVVIVFAVVIGILYRYAPADTEARPLIGSRLRKELNRKAVTCGVVVGTAAFLIPSESIRLLLMLGAVYQSISILPLTYKILRRSERNYESYECA